MGVPVDYSLPRFIEKIPVMCPKFMNAYLYFIKADDCVNQVAHLSAPLSPQLRGRFSKKRSNR